MEGVLSRTLAVTDTLKEILSGVSEQEIEAVLQELLRVKRENKKVYTIAAGRANLIMRTFAMRLMPKLGYKNYRNMLLDLERADEGTDSMEEIQLADSIQATNEKVKLHTQKLLDLTLDINSAAEFQKAVEMIRAAKIIFCFGFLSTNSVADHMNELLQLFGLNSFCLDSFATMTAARNQGKDGLLIVFSKSGETAVTNRVARYAKERGLKIIGVTNMAPNTMAPYLDVWIKSIHSEVRTRFMHYTETLPLFFIVDCIILNLYKQDFSGYSDCVREHVAITKSMQEPLRKQLARDEPEEEEKE